MVDCSIRQRFQEVRSYGGDQCPHLGVSIESFPMALRLPHESAGQASRSNASRRFFGGGSMTNTRGRCVARLAAGFAAGGDRGLRW